MPTLKSPRNPPVLPIPKSKPQGFTARIFFEENGCFANSARPCLVKEWRTYLFHPEIWHAAKMIHAVICKHSKPIAKSKIPFGKSGACFASNANFSSYLVLRAEPGFLLQVNEWRRHTRTQCGSIILLSRPRTPTHSTFFAGKGETGAGLSKVCPNSQSSFAKWRLTLEDRAIRRSGLWGLSFWIECRQNMEEYEHQLFWASPKKVVGPNVCANFNKPKSRIPHRLSGETLWP